MAFVFDLQRFAEITVDNLTDLQTAIGESSTLSSGDTIKLGGEITTTETLTIAKSGLTLDLNGQTLTTSAAIGIKVKNGVEFTLSDSTDTNKDGTGQGKIEATYEKDSNSVDAKTLRTQDKAAVVMVGENVGSTTNATFNMNSGQITSTKLIGIDIIGESNATFSGGSVTSEESLAVYFGTNGDQSEIKTSDNKTSYGLGGGGTFNMTGGKLESHSEKLSTIQVSGNHAKTSTINISGGEVVYSSNSTAYDTRGAILVGGLGNVTIRDDAKITSTHVGIEFRAGKLNVTGGTIQSGEDESSADDYLAYTPGLNASFHKGIAIAVAQHYTRRDVTVDISGGTIKGYTALTVADPETTNKGAFGTAISSTSGSQTTDAGNNTGVLKDGVYVVGTVEVNVTGGNLISTAAKNTTDSIVKDDNSVTEDTRTADLFYIKGRNSIINLDERVKLGLSDTNVEGGLAATEATNAYDIKEGNKFTAFDYENSNGLYSYYEVAEENAALSMKILGVDQGWHEGSTEGTFEYGVKGATENITIISKLAPGTETNTLKLTQENGYSEAVNLPLNLASTYFASLNGDYTVLDASGMPSNFALNLTANNKVNSIVGGAGADSLTAGSAGVSLNGGTGNDSLVGGSGADMFFFTAGSDTIANYDSANDNVSIGAGLTAPTGFDKATFTNGNFVISLSASSDSLTFENTSEFSLKDASDTYYYKANSNGIESIAKNTDGITLGAGFGKGSYDGSKLTYKTIDAQAVTVGGGLKITGNDEDSTLIGASTGGEIKGGYGNDELQASATNATVTTILDGDIGNDLLKGSDGADTFVYSAGNDSIQNYAAGDLVSVKGLNPVDAAYSVAESGSNISLDFGGGDLLVFENVIENGVSLKGSGGNYIYTKDYYAVNDRSVTLAENYNKPVKEVNTFDASGTNFRTIDAAAVSTAVSVMGNTLNNKIFGSKAGGTLNGGDGNDTFDLSERTTTSDGVSYVFQYTAGKDVVDGFVTGDKLEIDDTLVAGITSGKASDGKLAFNFSNKSNALTFLSANDDLNAVSLQSNDAFLTKDGVVSLDASDSASFKLFANAKGRIDLTDAPYKGADIKTVDARAVKNQSVTLVSGTQGGNFIFAANNKKKDMFEYGGGSVTITNYEAGNDRLNLGAASISGFEITNGNADVKLTVDSDKVISLVGAAQHEILIHDANSKSNSYSKLVFYDNGVLHNKERRPTEATISAANTTYSAADLPSIKKIFVTNNVSGVNVTAGNNKTTLDASEANGVTFIGGAKNDKFIASKGTDTFVYRAGKDVITGYTSSDIITLGDDELKMESAKITSSKKSLKFKFTNKNALNIKSDDTISSVQIGGGTFNFDKNAIISGGNVTLTSQFSGTFKTDDKDLSTNATYVDGERVTKNLTFKGTTAQETLVGGQKKTTFKGGGGADSLVGGSGKDIFFYAKGDSGTSTIANFDFTKDKVKIANGTIGKISTVTGGGVQFDMTSGKKGDISTTGTFQIKTSATYTDGEYTTSDAFTIDKVLIKANNTYYWFAEAAGNDINDKAYASGALITHDTKISKTAASGYAVIDLGYSTNLVKSGVAVKVASTGENAVSLPEKD